MISNDDMEFVLRCIRSAGGRDMSAERHYLVKPKLHKLAQQKGINLPTLLEALRADNKSLHKALIEVMCNHETSFFRDPAFFASLRDQILPGLIQRKSPERQLRIWSAACATGQEVWSLALLLDELPELREWDVQIIATDISRVALKKARSGCYSMDEVGRGLPTQYLISHFQRKGLEWEVLPDLRQRVRFRTINLIGKWPRLPVFDVVLLRNVLIYFDARTQRQVLARVQDVMQLGGVLMMGGCESPLALTADFLPEVGGTAPYYRRR